MQTSPIDGEKVPLTIREQIRVDRALSRVFPARQMRNFARREQDRAATEKPNSRTIAYAVISQEDSRFVLAAFSSEWNSAVNVLAIYRLEDGYPNQVWRSSAWQGSYEGMSFTSAKVGAKNIVMFREGGMGDDYGLAGVFSFRNYPKGLIIRDMTPSLPWLRASTRFPLRPLLGQHIALAIGDKRDLLLTASDEQYNMNMTTLVRPGRSWRYNKARARFEKVRTEGGHGGAMTMNHDVRILPPSDWQIWLASPAKTLR